MGIPCWVITLNPDSTRTVSLLRSLAEQGVAAETYPGVDGRNGMPPLEEDERLDNDLTRLRRLAELSPTEVGCYLSHLRLIRDAYEKGLEMICILEDDVELEPKFGPLLEELAAGNEQIDMLRLMALKVRRRKVVRVLSDQNHQLVRPERGGSGTQGYLISRSGMKKVLAYGSVIFDPIDKLYDHFWEFDLKSYLVEPHIILETGNQSSIVKAHQNKAQLSAIVYLVHPILKIIRSIQRKRYLSRHRKEFYPNSFPEKRPGKTKRMNYKPR